MKYAMMFADQVRTAIEENWPVVLPVGVLEYHAEHCVTGVDTLLVVRAVEELEKEMDLVMLPPFHYGTASDAVAPPEKNGTVNIDASVVNSFAGSLFRGLLRVGFRNIHVFIHHQSENFTAGMPTDLAFKFAARQELFHYLDKEHGAGWWGSDAMKDYYTQHGEGADPFSWIQVHPLMDAEAQSKFPIDHAGWQETSLMMSFCPEGVDMDRLDTSKWFVKEAGDASKTCGDEAKAMILRGMRKKLGCF